MNNEVAALSENHKHVTLRERLLRPKGLNHGGRDASPQSSSARHSSSKEKQGRLLNACPVDTLRLEFNHLRYTRPADGFIGTHRDRRTDIMSRGIISKGW